MDLQPDDAINIQFTSGTTGLPKGATLSHYNILNNGYFVGRRIRLTERDRICIPVPLYHCFGMVMGNLAAIVHGAAMIYPAESFDPVKTLETVDSERATALYGVPTMFIAELETNGFQSPRLVEPENRDHGGLAVPGRSDEARDRPNEPHRNNHLLRDDRDESGELSILDR